ncbi:hypothetical protein DFJ58DRAFT_865000 [Suillus subalutaceus]|uniref:uncharacterized protein n=1 Tax=Suillus subalutaceus TaxID=48586 RepID=UPI001B873EFD|nr:uncharacterized protein DFJ58DRAFT_865000 [Suillus subalutaceus]KAG1836521.1 hypothetical protein DFJ58DRAFT_865000 [Suillus subalutaceus]
MGRHLGVTSCALLIVGKIIGTGVFSTPFFILSSVGSVSASLIMLWVLGFLLGLCGLSSSAPRSLAVVERRYTSRPSTGSMSPLKYSLPTLYYLGFTASGCIEQFLLLIKAIALFYADQHQEATLLIKELVTACPNVGPLMRPVVETYLRAFSSESLPKGMWLERMS